MERQGSGGNGSFPPRNGTNGGNDPFSMQIRKVPRRTNFQKEWRGSNLKRNYKMAWIAPYRHDYLLNRFLSCGFCKKFFFVTTERPSSFSSSFLAFPATLPPLLASCLSFTTPSDFS